MDSATQEKIIIEICGEARYCLLGFIAVPLLFVLIDLPKGYRLSKSIALSFDAFIHNPYMLGIAFVLECLVFLGFMRVSNQKLILTETKLINVTGIFKVERIEIPLEDIESIYTVVDKDFFAKKLHCAAVSLEVKGSKKQQFGSMKSPAEFVERTNRQIALVKRSKE